MADEEEIRGIIFEKIRELWRLRKAKERFVPGRTPINYAGRVYDEKEIISLVDSSLEFWLTSGRYATRLEEGLARFLRVRHCLLTNSGSSANLLAISALTSPALGERRLRPGDEVLTTACGFPTTLNPILQNGLTPVFIDVEPGTYNVRADRLEEAVSDRTKAVFVPHTLGNPADVGKILEVTGRYGLWFVEDNCDALGALYDGRPTGSFGHLSTCSFYPAHHMTTGEGGAVLTNDPGLKKVALSFRDWGRDCWCGPGQDNSCGKRFSRQPGDLPYGYDHKYVYSHIGYNLKMTDLQAAVGVEQLKRLPSFIARRRHNFGRLYEGLGKYREFFVLPRATERSEPSWFGFPLMVRADAPFTRADIVGHLEGRRIATRMLFGGNLTRQPAYKNTRYRISGSLENTDMVAERLFWVGVYPGLTDEMIDYVIGAFDDFIGTVAGRAPRSAGSIP